MKCHPNCDGNHLPNKIFVTDVEAGAVEPQQIPFGVRYLLTLPPPTHYRAHMGRPGDPIPKRLQQKPEDYRRDLLYPFREHVPVTHG